VNPGGWVHQSVIPTSSSGAVSPTASVSDGTNETIRPTARGTATRAPVSSQIERSDIRLRLPAMSLLAGTVSPLRVVPAAIPRPEYVGRDNPTPYTGPEVKDAETIER